MSIVDQAFDDLKKAVSAVDQTDFEAALRLIEQHHQTSIMGYGCGREGLQVQGFIMRLAHLGFHVSMQGDMAAPPLGPSDLLIVSAGPGELSTVRALMETARTANAKVLLITAQPGAPLCDLANETLVLPAVTMADDQAADPVLPMGSLYEGAMFILFEMMILRLTKALGETAETMRARHTNME